MARPLTSRALAACAAVPVALAAQAPAPAPGGPAPEPALVESCTTSTLSAEEIASGLRSEVTCSWVDRTQLSAQRARSDLVAVHYDGGPGSAWLNVTGTCSERVAFSAGSPWNDRISSTSLRSCGTVKHFVHNDFTGGPELAQGGYGLLHWLSGYLDNQVSSIAYAV